MKSTDNKLTLGIGKTRFILAIAVLFTALVFSGTFEQAAFADGPETPPEATTVPPMNQDIDSYLDKATEELISEMNPTFQGFVADAWTHLKQIAPSEDWEGSIQDIIPQIHSNAEEQGGLLGAQGAIAANSSCSFTYYTELGESGWAAAVTKSSCTKDFLIAKVLIRYIGGPSDSRSCFNCRSVFAYVNGLPCGYYVADGRHEWGNPSVTKSSSDDGQAGCQ